MYISSLLPLTVHVAEPVCTVFYISNQYSQTAQIQPRLHYMSLTYP